MAADEAIDEAQKAVTNYTRRGMVFVMGRGDGGKIEWPGSGSLWRTAAGNTLVLTAKHVVEDHRSFTIGTTEGPEVRLHNAFITKHPSLDLALIRLPEGELSALAFATSALSDVTTVSKGAPLVVSGFPEHISFTDHDDLGEILRCGDMTSYSIAAGSDATSLSVEWKQTTITEETAQRFAKTGAKAGLQGLKKPKGLSGGAVWLWDNAGASAVVWVPSLMVRMVGVPVEFKNQRELAVPIWTFRDWLLSALQ